jgi:hypothetical protein
MPGRRGGTLVTINTLTLLAAPAGHGLLPAAAAATFGPTGRLQDFGPLQRQVRVLLWKHEVPEWNAKLGVNTVELVEKLEKKLSPSRG